MQDSLEDYLKICKHEKQDELQKINQDALITLRIKKECNDRALKFVEFLIGGKLRPESFLRCLRHINQSHYQDVVEERAISKLCGYPICGNKIPEMPKKQYHISMKLNKVYDITDRKNYCSNFCYKASLHIKAQIETSPLWLRRDHEEPQLKLLPASENGLPGEEIDQGIVKPDLETPFTSVSLFTEISLDDMIGCEIKKKPKKRTKVSNDLLMQSLREVDEDVLEENLNAESEEFLPSFEKDKNNIPTLETDESKITNKPCETPHSVLKKVEYINDVRRNNLDSLKDDPIEHLKKCLKQWFTLDTCIYLHSEKRVRDILNEKEMSRLFDKLRIDNLQREQQMKYFEICRKLHMKELADEKFDKFVLKMNLKPVPDYKTLKEESKNLDLKVKTFLSGIPYQKKDVNMKEKVKAMISDVEKVGPPAVLPLADNTAQNALRRRIFLNSLGKVIQQFCYYLNTDSSYILSNIHTLVQTFKFKPHNVTFKPAIWNLIGIICMKILTIKDEELDKLLCTKGSEDYFNSLTKNIKNFRDIEIDILNTLRDVTSFVENYIYFEN